MLTRSGFSQERQAAKRMCHVCERPFFPARMGQNLCGPVCGIKYGKRLEAERKAKAKADRQRLQELRESIPKLIAKAQDAFNAFIRERDKDKGCFVCGRPFIAGVPGRNLHAGHVRSRGAAGHLRFVEDNCMGECEGCNGPNGAKPHQIKAGAIARIGRERYEELENDNDPHKWERDELKAIAATYKQKLKELRACSTN